MAISVVMPKLGLTMTEGMVEEWSKQEGETVEKGDVLCSISSEKLSQDIEAEAPGILLKIAVPAGETAPCTAPIAYIGEAGERLDSEAADNAGLSPETRAKQEPAQDAAALKASPAALEAPANNDTLPSQPLFVSKLARRMARDHQLDVRQVKGTGGRGRVTRRDIECFLAHASEQPAVAAPAPIADQSATGQGLSGMRKAIAANMMQSLHSTAQLTLHRKVDVTSLMTFRQEMKARVPENMASGTFSINVLLLKAVALALRDLPAMNSRYDGQQLTHPGSINIGIAVALDEGLVVPVMGDVDKQPLSQLAKDFRSAVQGAGNGDAGSGLQASFSMTNLGAQGIEYFTPVLNPPESGILGIGTTSERLYLDDSGAVKVARELPLSLTFDHQVIDGAPAADFLAALSGYLEAPYSLLL